MTRFTGGLRLPTTQSRSPVRTLFTSLFLTRYIISAGWDFHMKFRVCFDYQNFSTLTRRPQVRNQARRSLQPFLQRGCYKEKKIFTQITMIWAISSPADKMSLISRLVYDGMYAVSNRWSRCLCSRDPSI